MSTSLFLRVLWLSRLNEFTCKELAPASLHTYRMSRRWCQWRRPAICLRISVRCMQILFDFFKVKTHSKWNWKKCGRCRTISGHIFANCIDIFHKTEVQKVILRCLRSLYLIWFKSHGTKCSKRPIAILAKSETLPKKLQLINGHFTTILGHFFADCMNIFHKTEVQAVIFRC